MIKKEFPETLHNRTSYQPSGDFVTFKQFIQFVANHATLGNYLNDHFSPYYDICRPCDIKYDFIGRIETMQIDSQFIIKKLFGSSPVNTLLARRESTHGSEVRDMFQSLPKDLVNKLYFAFQPDFDMYGYSLENM